ncbi:uncharacterized protein BJ171DRAFT_601749 [Polychytrium aggregatum]|uniref:uncharacterized protein n=1 Tax=Polychytrium aggregatum TaxID=110093 RepID=UPI0022FEED06|nr:uncharacterized protein BJ171DRAFT_601749 [Polychytrium aggregatum]KAI9199602.1 hypothetical protein BJ171DRAFT_601749 [Polychytrium aggregatum]
MPPKKEKKGKGGGKKKKEAEQEAQNLIKLQELKRLRKIYGNQCKRFVSEPLPAVSRKLDKGVSTLESVDKIILNSMVLTPNDLYAITRTFKKYTGLLSICVWAAKIDIKGLMAMAELFVIHPSVSTLQLIHCNITSEMTKPLQLLMRESKSLKTLIADHNPLGTIGTTNIFRGIVERHRLYINPSTDATATVMQLAKLSLKYCDAGPDCAEVIAEVLAVNRSIVEIDLTGNSLGDVGLARIAVALAANNTLKTLCLASNLITDQEPLPPLVTSLSPAAIHGSSPTSIIVKPTNTSGPSHPNDDITAPDSAAAAAAATAAIAAVAAQVAPAADPASSALSPTFIVKPNSSALSILCSALTTESNGLTLLDLRGNHVGERGGRMLYEMMKLKKALVTAKKCEGLVLYPSERMSLDLYEKIWDLNDSMGDSGKKSGKKGSAKKKK